MNRCSFGFLKKNILRSATNPAFSFRVMSTSSGDEDSHQGIPVGGGGFAFARLGLSLFRPSCRLHPYLLTKKVASLKSGEEGLAVKEISGTEGIKSPGSTCSGPQDTIQQFKPQAGVSTVANATRLPDKVMAILLNDEAPDAIWWLQKGTAFAMQKEKFQTQILDKHFRGNKFKSLVRNLHRWYDTEAWLLIDIYVWT